MVNLADGTLIGERFRLDTPQPATPDAVASTVHKVAENFDYQGPYGCAFPGVVTHGVVHTAANVDESWVGVSLVDAVSGTSPARSPRSTTPTRPASPRSATAPARATPG